MRHSAGIPRVSDALDDLLPQTGIASIRFCDLKLEVLVQPCQQLVGASAELRSAGFFLMERIAKHADSGRKFKGLAQPQEIGLCVRVANGGGSIGQLPGLAVTVRLAPPVIGGVL